MIATDYDEAAGKFTKVYPFTFNNQSYSVSHPTISPNGRLLVFSANMHGGSDLYLCTRNKNGKWNRPQGLGKAINTEGEEVFPWLANDTTLIFASDGHPGLGGLDVYLAHWDDSLKTFVDPTNAGLPVNSPYDDISMALQPDASSGYFSSNRPAEKGGDNVYWFKK
jgi:Tol biopolymer transport system component